MNKIIVRFGMLFFFLSLIYFSQKEMALEDILVRSLFVFIAFTFVVGLIALVFLRLVNKASYEKQKEIAQNLTKE